jgi:putative glutamine amidotransferase
MQHGGNVAIGSLHDVHRPRIGITSANHEDGHAVARDYVEAVVVAGGLPVMLPILVPELAPVALRDLDGLLCSGGGDIEPGCYGQPPHPDVYGLDPARDAWELALLREADVPVLGICRGSQLLNTAAGGTLFQHLPDRTDVVHRDMDRKREILHDVEVRAGSRLHAVIGALQIGVNSLHHQAVEEVGKGFVEVAWAPDGTIEAIEAVGDRPVLGVQWHPELLIDRDAHLSLFNWLVAAADAHRLQAPAIA